MSCPVSQATEHITDICKRTFQRPDSKGRIPRQFHDKTHACLRGTLLIDDIKQPELRHGLFAQPGSYPAVIRFSSSFLTEDKQPDGRGLAIKIQGVSGTVCEGAPAGQQDFVLINQTLCPFANHEEALAMMQELEGKEPITPEVLLAPRYTFRGWNPLRFRWHALRAGLQILRKHALCKDLTRYNYHSLTPYRLGEDAVQYQCHPDSKTLGHAKARGKDFRDRLEFILEREAVGFDFLLQRRSAGESLDDAGRPWKGVAIKVGHLHIPKQDIASGIALGDRLAFAPWNCLQAHEPLGTLNEVRRVAYRQSMEARGGDPVFPDS